MEELGSSRSAAAVDPDGEIAAPSPKGGERGGDGKPRSDAQPRGGNANFGIDGEPVRNREEAQVTPEHGTLGQQIMRRRDAGLRAGLRARRHGGGVDGAETGGER